MLEFDDLLDLEFNLILKEFTGLCPIELIHLIIESGNERIQYFVKGEKMSKKVIYHLYVNGVHYENFSTLKELESYLFENGIDKDKFYIQVFKSEGKI